MDDLTYLRTLASMGSPPEANSGGVPFLRRLIEIGRSDFVPPAAQAIVLSPVALDEVFNNRDRIIRRLLGANMLAMRELDDTSAAFLRVLEAPRDLLHSIGLLNDEEIHTKTLATLMNPEGKEGGIGYQLLKAFLELLNVEWATLFQSRSTEVFPEYTIGDGRVDLCIKNGSADIFVEVKVHAAEGKGQLNRYGEDQKTRGGDGAVRLGYLTLSSPNERRSKPQTTHSYAHIGFESLLLAWLPVAANAVGSEADLLRLYLKSLALLLDVTGVGRFERWGVMEQRRALQLVGRRGD